MGYHVDPGAYMYNKRTSAAFLLNLCCCNRLIGELRRLSPMALNQAGDTPFHVAAYCQKPAFMAAMLETFPTCCFRSENINDDFEKIVVSELLIICASRGNAAAVGHLIRRGADIEYRDTEVLRVIVEESIRSPSKSKLLLSVYFTIVDHAVLWWCTKMGKKIQRPDSAEYRSQMRRTVLYLLTKQSAKDDRSVIQYAINIGASKFLRAIVNTPGVFRFDDDLHGQQYVTYDVTDMTPFTRPPAAKADNVDELPR